MPNGIKRRSWLFIFATFPFLRQYRSYAWDERLSNTPWLIDSCLVKILRTRLGKIRH